MNKDDQDPIRALVERIDSVANKLSNKPEPDNHQPISGFDVCVEFVVPIAVGGYIGYYIDKKFATAPWWMLGLFFLGVLAGSFAVYRLIKKMK